MGYQTKAKGTGGVAGVVLIPRIQRGRQVADFRPRGRRTPIFRSVCWRRRRHRLGLYADDAGAEATFRSMMVEASLRSYTTDADEAAIGAGQTHIHFFPKEHTQSHFSQGYIHTRGLSRCLHTHTNIFSLCYTLVDTFAKCVAPNDSGSGEGEQGEANVDACSAKSNKAVVCRCFGVHAESRVQLGRRELEWPVAGVASGHQLCPTMHRRVKSM